MVQFLQNILKEGINMTDNQIIRKKISQNCVKLLEEKTRKERLTQDEIENYIISEIKKVINEEF